LIKGDSGLGERFSSLVSDATRLGYSEQDARAVLATLQLGRAVIDAKHRAYQDKPVSERVEALTRREWIHSIRETQIPESQMEDADIREVGNLMYRQGSKTMNPYLV
jgi:hypothetical protein